MIYTEFKQTAEDNNWVFIYARKDFQNLFNEIEDKEKIYLFLDPIQRSQEFDEYGSEETVNYSGTFMLLKSSDFDEGYQERYEDDIRPLINAELGKLTKSLACTDLTINSWNTTEIVNIFDYNLDGIVVKFTISS
jgi:hypothetical protein